jgi:hypothetical protein
MTTRARTTSPKLRAWWHNPPATPRVTLARQVSGRTLEREVGPAGVLTLAEAAAVLDRPVADVRRAIRTRFLPARRRQGQLVVTVRACYRFREEERADGESAMAAVARARQTGARPIPWARARRELGLE